MGPILNGTRIRGPTGEIAELIEPHLQPAPADPPLPLGSMVGQRSAPLRLLSRSLELQPMGESREPSRGLR